jgi:hypothetical protein
MDELVIEPAGAFPARYYAKNNIRISADITRFKVDGVWYHGNGIRDEMRSPKEDLPNYAFRQDKFLRKP